MRTDNQPKTKKKSTPTLTARQRHDQEAEVLSLSAGLPPVPPRLFRSRKKAQFSGKHLRYTLLYTSAARYVVLRVLLRGRDVLQCWYSPRGFITILQVPNATLRAAGIQQPPQTAVLRTGRALPDLLNHIPLTRDDIRILEDETLRRRGIREDLLRAGQHWDSCITVRFIHRLFNDVQFETLRKIGLPLNVLTGWHYDQIVKEWYRQTIALCNAGKQESYDIYTWLDYLKMLKDEGRDTSNPKVFLPDDLDYAHAMMVNRRQRRLDRQRRRQRLEHDRQEFLNIPEQEKQDYERKISPFLGIKLSDGRFRISTLPTIEDHYRDAVTLKYCLFHNKYYQKENVVIVRIVKEDHPEKTYANAEIEYRKGEILQIYGNLNVLLPQKEHNAVKALINANIKRYINAGKRSRTRPLLAVETFTPAFN